MDGPVVVDERMKSSEQFFHLASSDTKIVLFTDLTEVNQRWPRYVWKDAIERVSCVCVCFSVSGSCCQTQSNLLWQQPTHFPPSKVNE